MTRIGAPRFWIAEFDQGKPTVELALKVMQALGLIAAASGEATGSRPAARGRHRRARRAR